MVLPAGTMYRPYDITSDISNDTIYVAEHFNHRISKWDYTPGSYTFTLDASWGSNSDGTSGEGGPIGDGGSTDNALYRPTGLSFDAPNGLLYVTDTFHNRVRVLNASTGAFTTSIGTGGSGTSDFYHPAGIAINLTDTVVIADELNHRVVKYTANGGTLDSPVVLPDPTTGSDLSFVRPHGVVFDGATTNFTIGDSQRSLISNYTEAGAYIDQFGTPGTTGTDLFFPSSGEGRLQASTNTAFADTRNNNIKSVNNQVIAVTTGTSAGTGNSQLYYPESVAAFTDSGNYVLIANTLNNRVEIFSSSNNDFTPESPFNFGSP